MEENKTLEFKDKTGKITFKVLNFENHYVPPTYKYNKGRGIVEWGAKNEYPEYILDLYNTEGSPTHKDAIDTKVRMLVGNGIKKVVSPELQAFINDNELMDEMDASALDYELFNGFAIEVIWAKDKKTIASMKSIPIHKLRIGIENDVIDFDHFWFSNNWAEYKKEMYAPEMIPKFDPDNRVGKQIYYFIQRNPKSDGLYPIVGYSNSFNFITIESEFGKYHYNQIKNGYSPDFMLSFNTGIPNEEEQDEIQREFDNKFQNRKGGSRLIIAFAEGAEQAPTFTPIQANDSDSRFTELMDTVENLIVRGHSIPPQLVILQEGKLGATEQREELMMEFQQKYINSRQKKLESVYNKLLGYAGFAEKIELNTYLGEEYDQYAEVMLENKATLRSSVNGVDGILKIQASIATGATTLDSGVAIVVMIYGVTEEEARLLIGNPAAATPANQFIIPINKN